jgi:hypothetical protein
MKAIHYDTEGDILSITFVEANRHRHTGVELSDNIVLYFDPATEQPLELILSSYQALVQAHSLTPLSLDGLAQLPAGLQATILRLLHRAPLNTFLQLVEQPLTALPASRLREIFSPALWQSVAVR